MTKQYTAAAISRGDVAKCGDQIQKSRLSGGRGYCPRTLRSTNIPPEKPLRKTASGQLYDVRGPAIVASSQETSHTITLKKGRQPEISGRRQATTEHSQRITMTSRQSQGSIAPSIPNFQQCCISGQKYCLSCPKRDNRGENASP